MISVDEIQNSATLISCYISNKWLPLEEKISNGPEVGCFDASKGLYPYLGGDCALQIALKITLGGMHKQNFKLTNIMQK